MTEAEAKPTSAAPPQINGRDLAAPSEPPAQDAERATSSVLALDGWGRIEAEPRSNGASEALPPEPPLPEPFVADAVEAVDAETLSQAERELTGRVMRRSANGAHSLSALKLLGPALGFGFCVGALVGVLIRWWEVRRAPPPPPPPRSTGGPLREAAQRVRNLVAPTPPPPPPPKRFWLRLR